MYIPPPDYVLRHLLYIDVTLNLPGPSNRATNKNDKRVREAQPWPMVMVLRMQIPNPFPSVPELSGKYRPITAFNDRNLKMGTGQSADQSTF